MTLAEATADAFTQAMLRHADAIPCRAVRDDSDSWFSPPGSKRDTRAKELCQSCPIVSDCAAYALANGIPAGVWGGLDEKQREAIWFAGTGRPDAFARDLDRALAPAFQARRDFERAGNTNDYESEKVA